MWGFLSGLVPAGLQTILGFQDANRIEDLGREAFQRADQEALNLRNVGNTLGLRNFIQGNALQGMSGIYFGNQGVGARDIQLEDFFGRQGQSGYDVFRQATQGVRDVGINPLDLDQFTYDAAAFRDIADRIAGDLQDSGGPSLLSQMQFDRPDFEARERAGLDAIREGSMAREGQARQQLVSQGLASGQSLESLNPTLTAFDYTANQNRASAGLQNRAIYEGQRDEWGRFQDTLEANLLGQQANLDQARQLAAAQTRLAGATTAEGFAAQNLRDLLGQRASEQQLQLGADQFNVNRLLEQGRVGGQFALADQQSDLARQQAQWNAFMNTAGMRAGLATDLLNQRLGLEQAAAGIRVGNTQTYVPRSGVINPLAQFWQAWQSRPETPDTSSGNWGFGIGPFSFGGQM